MAEMSLKEFQAWLRKQPQQIQGAVVRGLRSAAQRGVGVVVQEIDNATPHPAVNTGRLRQSARAESNPMGASVVVDAPHAAIINDGTRPFRPPLAPLVEWVVRKFGVDEADAYPIAKAVQDKIAAEGIEPRFYFDKAMKRINEFVDEEVQHELNKLGAA
jgi:hypothetical protein